MSGHAVDYFLVVGPSTPFQPVRPHSHTPSPRTVVPALSFIDRAYRADLLFRYPPADHPHLAFPSGISMFCMTDDLRLSSSLIMPKFFYFVATGSSGERLYGSCLKFYEELPDEAVRSLLEEDERLRLAREREERERSEQRRKEVSVSLSREEERETELEEEREREQAMKLVNFHNKIQEDSQRWRKLTEETQQRAKQQQQQQQHQDGREEKHRAEPFPPSEPHLTIHVQSSPHGSQPASSASSSSSSDPDTADAPRSRSSPVSAETSPSVSPSPHLLQPVSAATPTTRSRKVYAPKCVCVLSLHAFLSQCRSFLSELYRISLVPSPLPLEHIIANFVNEVPLPPLGELKVQYSISNKLVYFFRSPPNNPLLCTHYPLRLLFECLDSENALAVIEAVLLEHRILLLSTKLSALTVVAETLLHLIFPLRWPHVYIPLLPRSLIDFLFTPMPFIIGMHHAYVKGQLDGDVMTDILVVDLDANVVVHHAPAKRVKQLPARERKKLKRGLALLRLYKPKAQRTDYERRMLESMDDAFQYAPSPEEIEQLQADLEREEAELSRYLDAEGGDDAVAPATKPQRASSATSSSSLSSVLAGLPSPSPVNHELFISSVFFRAFVSLLKDYRPYLILPTAADPAPDPCFNHRGFLRHHDSSSHPFLRELLGTQAFTAFCEERIFPSSAEAQHEMLFFDQSIVAKKNRSRLSRRHETPFLLDERWAMKETYVVPAADVVGCKGYYRYERWPQLDVKLFPMPRKVPAMYMRRPSSLTAMSDQRSKQALMNGTLSLTLAAQPSTTLEQVLYTVWFMLVSAIASELKIHHMLNTAFKVLYDARLSSVTLEEDVFVGLMKACGACAIPDRAVEVMSIMQESGYTVSGGMYGQLLQVFSVGGGDGIEAMKRLSGGKRSPLTNHSPAASPHASVSRDDSENGAEDDDEQDDEDEEEELSITSSTRSATSVQSPTNADPEVGRMLSPSNSQPDTTTGPAARPNGAAGSALTAARDGEDEDDEQPPDPCSNAIDRPSPDDLTRFHRNFVAAFPHLSIDTTDRCPECRRELSDREIRSGWTHHSSDYTTACPKCGDRFAAQFVVSINPKPAALPPAAEGTAAVDSEEHQHQHQRYLQGKQYVALNAAAAHSSSERFPLTLPYLPPRVLKRELGKVIEEHSVAYIMHPSFRLHSTTLYWNLAWHLLCLCLPVQMLLWDMSDVPAVSSERMEMVHVMRSTSSEERGKRVEDSKRQRMQRVRRRRRLAAQRNAELSMSSGASSPSALYGTLMYSPTEPSADLAPVVGEGRLATVQEKASRGTQESDGPEPT